MCTAIAYTARDFYFGRTLDYEIDYHEEVVFTPRNVPFHFQTLGGMPSHYAMIGVGVVAKSPAAKEDFPLYFEAVNERGLGLAGLNFVGNAHYQSCASGWDNLAPYELIPWILGQCATAQEAKSKLQKVRMVSIPFSAQYPLAENHWLLADKNESLVIEPTAEGLMVYENPVGALTNNPGFPQQLFRLNNFMSLSPSEPTNRFSDQLPLTTYSRGMGALGLPGDLSSESRFVRAAFTQLNSVCTGKTETERVNQFFHILGTVEQVRGVCRLKKGEYEVTQYTCCCNGDKGIFYYTTYENHQIGAVDMHRENLDGSALVRYPLNRTEQIRFQN